MRLLEHGPAAGAVATALATHSCCVPLGFLGIFGAAGVGMWLDPLRPWLLSASLIFLGLGFVRLYLRNPSGGGRSAANVAMFWGALAVVILLNFFPQVIPRRLAG